MSEDNDDRTSAQKIKEYQNRHIRWSDESLKQLSFYNNLLLTLSVGFLAFLFHKDSFIGVYFNYSNINWSLTILVGSAITITFSILLGLFVAINRLQDFRVSRKISFVRYGIYKHSKGLLDETTPDRFNFWKRLTLAFHNYPSLTIEECKAYKTAEFKEREKIRFKFRELRNIAHNLGRTSWNFTVAQTISLAIGIALYIFGILKS